MSMRKVVAAVSVAVVLLTTTSITAQAESASGPLEVAALGDSYASGTGAGDYYSGTEGVCWRSKNSYSELAVQELRRRDVHVSFANATCSGATVDDLRRSHKGQSPQLDVLTSSTSLVFLTIGGNDIGFGDYVDACLNRNCAGAPTRDVLGRLPGMSQKLQRLLGEIKARSPKAHIVFAGYGRPVTPGSNATTPPPADPICGAQVLTADERLSAAVVSSGLDLKLRWTADVARTKGIKVTYISPFANALLLEPSFRGHSLCESGMPFYRGFDALAPGQEGPDAILHLNQSGHAALYQLTRHAVGLAG